MRFRILVCMVGALSGCGGYHVNGSAVSFERCTENGCNTNPVTGADSGSFQPLSDDYAKDRYRVYIGGAAIQDADPNTFRILSMTYAVDKSRVYYRSMTIPGADPGTFVALSDLSYGRDRHDIYILGDPIGACDAPSFRWLKDDWQSDAKCAYRRGTKLPNAHPESFVVLNFWYAKDAQQVYSSVSSKPIVGADVATFRLSEGPCTLCAQDKNRCYNSGAASACGLK